MISLSCFTSFFFFFSWSAECNISTDNKRCSLSAPLASGVPCQPSSIPAPFPACSPLTWGAIIANRLRARSEQQDSLSLSSNWLPAKPNSLALPSHLSPQFRPVHSCPFSWCWLLYWPPTSFKMIQCTKQTDVKSGGAKQEQECQKGRRGNGEVLAQQLQQSEELFYSEGASAIRPSLDAPQAAETVQGPCTQNLLPLGIYSLFIHNALQLT